MSSRSCGPERRPYPSPARRMRALTGLVLGVVSIMFLPAPWNLFGLVAAAALLDGNGLIFTFEKPREIAAHYRSFKEHRAQNR